MRIVFMGTPEFAVPSLEACVQTGHSVVLVVTQPARPRGRGRKVAASAVEESARALGLPVLESERVNRPQEAAQIRQAAPDLICVTAFGQILSPEVLAIPGKGCVNVHASLLPRWRGAAPIHRALIEGDTETGITTMFMAEKMDAGDLILQASMPIHPDHTQETLSAELAELGGELLGRTVSLLDRDAAPRSPQDESAATYAPMLKKDDGRVSWNRSALQISNLIRGTVPWPGAFALWEEQRLRLWSARPTELFAGKKGSPGELVEIGTEGIVVGTGAGSLLLTKVQPENRRRMLATEWTRGARLRCGDRLR